MFSGDPGCATLAGLFRLEPARIDTIDRRTGERHAGVAMLVDAVVDHGGQVLIARDMEGEGFANFAQRNVAGRLRPAVGIVVGAAAAARRRAWWPWP